MRIDDDLGAGVEGALVTGTFTGDYDETVTATTAANGIATLTTNATKKGSVSFGFCVDSVVGPVPYNGPAGTDCSSFP